MLPTADKNLKRWDLKSVRPLTLSLRGDPPACTPDAVITHFYRIREEGGSGRPPTVHLRTDDVTWTY